MKSDIRERPNLTDNERMQSTMDQIELQDGPPLTDRLADLRQQVIQIEQNIKTAQEEMQSSNAQPYSYAPVSPEKDNERLKAIVFMKKDLEKKKLEILQLAN